MDWLLFLQAVIMGAVEGITEFLPISSTGHLIIVGDLLNFLDKERRDVFGIAIQLGAILAVCWVYRARLWQVTSTLHTSTSQHFVANVLIALLPAALLGFLLINLIKLHLFNPVAVACAFIIGGLVILWAEKRGHEITVQSVDDMGWRDALVFTAGIGEHAAVIRERVCNAVAWLGVNLNADANRADKLCISTTDSRVPVWVIPTNEELMIARHTANVLK